MTSALAALTLSACGGRSAATPVSGSQHSQATRSFAKGSSVEADWHPSLGPFAVLRRNAGASDRLPPRAAALVKGWSTATSGVALSADSARRLPSRDVAPMWLLAGRGVTCLLSTQLLPGRSEPAYSLVCPNTARAVAGFLVTTFTGIGHNSGRITVEGVVPDGVRAVTVNAQRNRHYRLAVHENVYATLGYGPQSITFRRSSVTHTVPLPLAPGSAPPPSSAAR